jgi:protein TonB
MPMPKTAPVPVPQTEAPVVVADPAPKPPANVLVATTPSPAPPIPVMPMAPEPMKNNAAEVKVSLPLPASTPVAPLPDASKTVNKAPGVQQTSSLPSLPIGIDTNWYQARQVDNQPKAIGVIEPAYPEEAKRRNQEGTLKLMLKIDDLGRVQSAEVVEATPLGVFDAAALEAFKSARFQPAMRDGRPVRYQAFIRVDFKFKD